MKIEERLEILKQVASVAALAGLRGEIDDSAEHFKMGFGTTEGRSQQVFIRPSGRTPDGQQIVTLFSPAHVFEKSMFGGFTKDQAVGLLRLNENTFFARFGIWESPKETMVVASSDLMLPTLDPEELRAHAFYVSFAADKYESAYGRDRF